MNDTQTRIHVDIVSPERPLYSGDAQSIVVPAHDGEVGILPRHAPMVLEVGVGEVRISKGTLAGESIERFAVSGGFLQTSAGKVTLVTEEACRPKDVNVAATREQLGEVNAALEKAREMEERDTLTARRSWLRAKLRLAEKA